MFKEKPAVKAIFIRGIDGKPHFFYQEKKEPRRFRTEQPITADIPGGGVEAGETREQAVLREIKEETNLDATHVKKVSEWRHERPEKGDVLVGSTHLCQYVSGEPRVSEELVKGEWRKTSNKNGLPKWLVDDLKAAGY